MRFSEIFAERRGPVISFEVFPPKADSLDGLRAVVRHLVELGPDFMTVTYGAMGSTRARTIEVASLLRREFSMEAACHLTCVGSSRDDIGRTLEEIRDAGIENIVALRGDPPQGQATYVAPRGGYSHGHELVRHIRRTGGFGIA